MSYIHINHEVVGIYSPLLLNVIKAQLNNDEVGLLLSPPCKLDLPIEELISPGNNKENLPTKSQNAFILYRNNNRKSPAIAKVAWDEELDKVKPYFKILEKLAATKFNLINCVIPSQSLLPYQFSSPCTSNDTNPSSSTCSNLSTSLSPHFAPPHFNINYNNSPISSSSCTNNNTNLSSSTCSNLSTSLSPYSTPYHPNINYNNSPNLSSSSWTKDSSSSCIPNSSYPQNNKLTQATQSNSTTKNATQPSQVVVPEYVFDPYHADDGGISYDNIMQKAADFQEVQKGTKSNNWDWMSLNANVEKINKEMEQSQINQQQQYKQIDYTSDRYTDIKGSNNEYNHINNSYINVRQQPNPNQT
nr:1500_t:CDS:2 [Entrophospora candida]